MYKILLILIFYVFAVVIKLDAQSIIDKLNLVKNSSFEKIDSCVPNSNAVFYLNDWRPLNNTLPLYHNACTPRPDEMPLGLSPNVPYTGSMDNFQFAHSGNAFLLLCHRYLNESLLYASYIETTLKYPLIKDTIYCVELFANLPDWSLKTDNQFIVKYYTALLSYESLDTNRYDVDSPYYDHDPSVHLYQESGDFINDTVNWVKLSGSYRALGGEQFLSLGAFRISYSEVKEVMTPSHNQIVGCLFIDDVAVYKGKCREEEKPQKTFFNLYPNPGSGLFSLNYGVAQDAQLLVYDILGRTVLSETLAADKVLHHFNLSQMSNGMYFLKVISKNDENLYSQKFLLQR